MTSSARRAARAMAPALLLAAACGQGVHDLSIGETPVQVVHGHVDQTQLVRVYPQAALLGVLVWAAPAVVNPVCIRLSDGSLVPNDPQQGAMLAADCPDPYGVFPGEAEAWAPVDADGNFDLPLYTLPVPRVSVGDAFTRIAYGALVVVEDVNGDGQPPFTRTPRRGFARVIAQDMPNIDRVVASTFANLHAPQQRIVFREGGFVTPSYFYPAPGPGIGCEPPPGFRVETAPPYADPPVGACTFDSADTRLEVPPLSVADGTAFLCRALTLSPSVTNPTPRPDGDQRIPFGPSTAQICLGTNVLATDTMGPTCPIVMSFALSGCAQDPLCSMPEWTVPAASLSAFDNGNGWPCQ